LRKRAAEAEAKLREAEFVFLGIRRGGLSRTWLC